MASKQAQKGRWLALVSMVLVALTACNEQQGTPITHTDTSPAPGLSAMAVNTAIGTPKLTRVQNPDGSWGVQIDNIGMASATAAYPIRIDDYWFGNPSVLTWGYTNVTNVTGGFVGKRTVSPISGVGVTVDVSDTWTISGGVVTVARSLTVKGGDALHRFMDAIVLDIHHSAARNQVDYFVPAMIYGKPSNLIASSIGGSDTYGSGYGGIVRIREDRMPAPMFGIRFSDNTSVTLLNPSPRGDTTKADSDDKTGSELWDTRFNFGALGAEQPPSSNRLKLGYWFPGSEGEVTVSNNSSDGPRHNWRLRLHPYQDGLKHSYTVQWRFASGENWSQFQRNAWRWAWNMLKPPLYKYNIDTVRRTLVNHMADRVIVDDPAPRAGIPNLWNIKNGTEFMSWNRLAFIGFIGKNLESAEYLLREAVKREGSADAARFRNLANRIIQTQIAVDQSPPTSEGVKLNTGDNVFFPKGDVCYLRVYSDDLNALLRAYQFEQSRGRTNPTWLAWVKDFADWLLPQQAADGSFPRAWNCGASTAKGTVYDASKNSSYLPVPLLLRLTAVTGDAKYRNAALKAGNFSWQLYQSSDFHFVGATPDHADIIDQEASALALDAYLELYQATNDSNWLNRAKVAADINESWYYLWNVPMPVDSADADLDYKKGVPTVGFNIVATGESFGDFYGVNNVDLYAKLYKYTNDAHYLEVARILMHNTRAMLALPGRTYDMAGPGWQQEHFNLSVPRGKGNLNMWVTWLAPAGLHGIFQTEAFDPALYNQIVN